MLTRITVLREDGVTTCFPFPEETRAERNAAQGKCPRSSHANLYVTKCRSTASVIRGCEREG